MSVMLDALQSLRALRKLQTASARHTHPATGALLIRVSKTHKRHTQPVCASMLLWDAGGEPHQDARERALAVQRPDAQLQVALLQAPHCDRHVLDQVRPSKQVHHRAVLRTQVQRSGQRPARRLPQCVLLHNRMRAPLRSWPARSGRPE